MKKLKSIITSRYFLFFLILVIFPIVMTALILVLAPQLRLERPWQFWYVILGFGFSLLFGVVNALMLYIRILSQLYGVSMKDAWGFVRIIFLGLPQYPPLHPIWRVQEGRADPDGPATMREIGGPGFLSVGHDSAVVTSRLGELKRVIGPGFHELDTFEKVWDVIDLRPQRRIINVSMMTRDGIPISCQASIRFRINDGGQKSSPDVPFPFDKKAVIKAATIKRRKAGGVVQDWTQLIAFGALDGAIRDRLEQHNLDEFLNLSKKTSSKGYSSDDSPPPVDFLSLSEESSSDEDFSGGTKPRDSSDSDDSPPSDFLSSSEESSSEDFSEELMSKDSSDKDSPLLIVELEEEIFKAVRDSGKKMGIIVEQVQLGPIQPDEEAVSRQWLEAWQSEWQNFAARQITVGEVTQKGLVELTRVQTQVELITRMVPIIQQLHEEGGEEARQVLLLRFLNVMQAMADQEPLVRHLMFQQAGFLQDVIAKLYGHEQMNHLISPDDQKPGDQPALTSSS